MILSIIAAVDEQGGIGIDNRIPWHMPVDLGRFKRLTMGHHLILGRKTYQSIGKPLPGRKMIVLSRDPEYTLEDCLIARSLQDALGAARDAGETELFIAGGAEIYQQALPLAEKMYLTRVDTICQADVFFPDYDPEDWLIICEQEFPADRSNPFAHTFSCLIRNREP